jgi:hypothetical protein
MSKKPKKMKDSELSGIELLEQLKEETEVKNKKGILTGIKEFGEKIPTPVKVIATVGTIGTAVAFGAKAAYDKFCKDNEDDDLESTDEETFEESEEEDSTDDEETEEEDSTEEE